MIRQIRDNVFETNSSSVHSICVSKNRINLNDLNASHVLFEHGEFGWEKDKYYDTYDKAAYLYQAIWDTTYPEGEYEFSDRYREQRNLMVEEKCQILRNIFDKHGIHYDFPRVHYSKDGWEVGYIDHGGELIKWVDMCLNDEEYLLTYLFGNAAIATGNDNSDYERCSYEDDEKYDIFVKSN